MSEISPAEALPNAESGPDEAPKRAQGPIRWFMLLAFVVVGLLLEFVLAGPFVKFVTLVAIAHKVEGEASIESVSASLLSGALTYNKLVATRGKAEMFGFEEASGDVDVVEALRGRIVIEELKLKSPRIAFVRFKNGLIAPAADVPPSCEKGGWGNPDIDLSEVKPEDIDRVLEEAAQARDTVDNARQILKKVCKVMGVLRQRYELIMGPGERNARRNPKLRLGKPRFLIKKISGEDLTLTFRDAGKPGAKTITLIGSLSIENISSDPFLYDHPMVVTIHGQLGGASGSEVFLQSSLDSRTGKLTSSVALKGLPAEQIDPYLKKSVPLALEAGTLVDLELKDLLLDGPEVEMRPLLTLRKIRVSVRDPQKTRKIAGLKAKTLAKELTAIGEITLADIRIHGSVDALEIDFGSTLENLVVAGAKSFVKGKVNAGIDAAKQKTDAELKRAERKLDKKVDKASGKIAKKLDKKYGKKLDKAGKRLGIDGGKTGSALKKGFGDLFGGAKDKTKGAAKDGSSGASEKSKKGFGDAFGGLWGGKKKKKKK